MGTSIQVLESTFGLAKKQIELTDTCKSLECLSKVTAVMSSYGCCFRQKGRELCCKEGRKGNNYER